MTLGSGSVALPPLSDLHARRVTYVRLSLTDRCNYRCTYCMPEEGVPLVAREEVLSFEEIERLIGCFARLGTERVRLTGGEPTVRQGVVEITARIARIAGLRDVAMTTNGHRLLELAQPLRDAGLGRLNVSLDTLDEKKFAAITRRGELGRVLDGIEAARAAGFTAIKINVVALRGFNDGEAGALCEYAWRRGLVPRFIEWMPMSDGEIYTPGKFWAAADIRAAVCAQAGVQLEPDDGITPQEGVRGGGPARYWRVVGGRQRVGIIAALTEHFCEACNRVRLSAAGQLHTCLARDEATDLRALVRSGQSDEALVAAIRTALYGKEKGHEFTLLGLGAPRKHMVSIGG